MYLWLLDIFPTKYRELLINNEFITVLLFLYKHLQKSDLREKGKTLFSLNVS